METGMQSKAEFGTEQITDLKLSKAQNKYFRDLHFVHGLSRRKILLGLFQKG